MANKSVKRMLAKRRTKRRTARKMRTKRRTARNMSGGSFDDDQLTISQFKSHGESTNSYDKSTHFVKNGKLTEMFSDEIPAVHDMYMLLKKNLIENITLDEILTDVYKLLPIPNALQSNANFSEVPKKIETLEELFEIRPNDIVEWNGFLFKFYDFNNKSHQEYKKLIKFSKEVCKKSIKEEYLTKSMADCDYLITVSDSKEFEVNKEAQPDLTNIYAFTMNNTLNYGTSLNTYTSTACSMEMLGDEGDKIISFGLLLMYIMMNYLKSIGFANGYNDASHKGLLPYYSRWNYRLGKGSCDLNDDVITVKHNELIELKNSEELDHFYDSLASINYESSSGYRMKLCGINLNGWREYLIKTNTGIKERLEANESVYTYYLTYVGELEKKRKIESLDKQIIEFEKLPTIEEKKKMAENLLKQIGIFYDNARIYKIVVRLIKESVITFDDINDDNNLMPRLKQFVVPGPYLPSFRDAIIKKIKERENIM